MSAPVLHQFLYSHFNDKARWALAWKGLDHSRRTYLPGPHMPALRRLSGASQTPVIELDGEVIAGSAAIIDALERRIPQPPLYPAAKTERERALALQATYDAELGPAVRTVLFDVLIGEPAYLCSMFAAGKPGWKRAAYRASFPLARPLMARGNGINRDNVQRSGDCVSRFLDEIARAVSGSGYLVGDQFSVADLTAAALLAPLCDPPVSDMQRPRPMPRTVERLLQGFADHAAISWTLDMYTRHRA